MKTKQRKSGQAETEILREIPKACIDENAAVEFMEKQRWGNMPACPHCGDVDVKKMTDSNGGRNKRFLWRCNGCKKQFTIRVGTVFEDSRIPLRIWCYAFWRACASKKGISALQISRECSITYKSALFLMHRIRFAMAPPNPKGKLQGTIEVDETYCGGRPRYRGNKRLRGRGTKKTPVMAVLQRGGDVRARVVPNVSLKTLRKVIFENATRRQSRLMTDQLPIYKSIGREFEQGHLTVNHFWNEYARGDATVNTAESFFAILKRGLYGTFHAVSKKHLHRYINEFEFKWNNRKLNDSERVVAAIKSADGKRLMYREPTIV